MHLYNVSCRFFPPCWALSINIFYLLVSGNLSNNLKTQSICYVCQYASCFLLRHYSVSASLLFAHSPLVQALPFTQQINKVCNNFTLYHDDHIFPTVCRSNFPTSLNLRTGLLDCDVHGANLLAEDTSFPKISILKSELSFRSFFAWVLIKY